MLTPEQRTLIFREVPTSFTINGQSITVAVRYSNQWNPEELPAIILNYTELSVKSYDFLKKIYNTTNNKVDDLTFVTGTTVYALSVTRITSITGVTGTLSGDVHTFVNNTDYQVTGDTIEWLGADEPDNGTEFNVEFTFKWTRVIKGGEKFDIMSVNIFTKDHGSVDDGTYINGIVLAEEISGQLHREFEFSMTPPDNVAIECDSTIINLDALTEGEYQRRRQFDVKFRHVEVVEMPLVESIDEVIEEVNLG